MRAYGRATKVDNVSKIMRLVGRRKPMSKERMFNFILC